LAKNLKVAVADMSRNSLKAIDLYCRVLNWNGSLENAYDEEIERWTELRDRELKKFRDAMSKVTLDEFLAGRWGNVSIENRMKQWDEMKAMAEGGARSND
jgi:hypothetical protein